MRAGPATGTRSRYTGVRASEAGQAVVGARGNGRQLSMRRRSASLPSRIAYTGEASDMWKPVVRCLDAFRSRSGPPSIAHFAIADLAIGCAYTFIVLLSLLGHEGWPGQAMRRWLQVTDGAIAALLFFLPAAGSPLPSDELSGVLVYRHLLVACAISTLACVWISRRHWPAWTNRFLRQAELRRHARVPPLGPGIDRPSHRRARNSGGGSAATVRRTAKRRCRQPAARQRLGLVPRADPACSRLFPCLPRRNACAAAARAGRRLASMPRGGATRPRLQALRTG